MPGDPEIKFMRRCLGLAAKAEGMTYPNPMVGAVVVHKGAIIGEGFHLKAGGPHAEVNAINSVADRSLLGDSTLYVNLEPCCHFGKTPPCTDIILSHRIKRVVAGTVDTSENVSGKGMATLQNGGCEVVAGVLEEECRRLNRRFFTFHEKKRPYVVLKWAQSADGFLDTERTDCMPSKPVWITGNAERVLVHRWRSFEQTILVGAETIRKDNPRLNVREWVGNDPVRLILSNSGLIDKESLIFKISGTNIVFLRNTVTDTGKALKVVLNDNESSAKQITDYLFVRGIQSLLVEGGAKVLEHFISEGLWDEARIFSGIPCFRKGMKAPVISGTLITKIRFSRSTLQIVLNSGSQHLMGY
ncbi:MAG: bifunctional diaminohydroxyphosphoribosylaminopyrimidine deaminase/5-amino-6-(5-phosphoribosylamino)uracil reductase RibD [Bacteroidales bacterium]|nr:bifunctional diaminohydroxyphosphoribosylaminopyrimidine deaminase/5-amino-6-(5-phosphoribosylamino)uracil reductase RibD [Bacteroidales bacterium]